MASFALLQNLPKAPADTIPDNFNRKYESTTFPSYKVPYRFGDPYSSNDYYSRSPLILSDPTEVTIDVEPGDSTINYSLSEKVGEADFRPPSQLTFDEFDRFRTNEIRQDFFISKSKGLDGESALSSRRLIPKIYTSPVFDRLFGGSYIDIRPNGFVTLDFGGRFQRVANPNIPVRQQRTGNFEFDQQISLNVIGTIGDKLSVTANFDNNNSFDFQNNVKVEYTGYEEEIIKKVEIGNVNLPVSNSLITGSQSLFGFKTQMQFGKLYWTSVASVQRGQSDVIEIESGTQRRDFEIRSSEYDENRHFFLGHFFRNNYENWINNTFPEVISGVNVTRVEVYVLNRNGDTQTLRNFAAFMDLGEPNRIFSNNVNSNASGAGQANRNNANDLFSRLTNGNPSLRNINEVGTALEGAPFNFTKSTDFELITSARKLEEREYSVNPKLGYITLSRRLQNDELLAVAYEYTYQGQSYRVGELTEDYQNRPESDVIFLKMLRPTKINTEVPTWDLMMKNVYSLNASQITRDGFQLRVVYRDDQSGVDNPSLNEGPIKDQQLISLLGLDQLNPNNDPPADGNFDYIDDLTIDTRSGTIIFPYLEPFGSRLSDLLGDNPRLQEQLVYRSLYNTTKAESELNTQKDKFFIKGSFSSGSSNEITLPGINISEGSVVVTAGGSPLTENVDYRVDYNLGRVILLNEGVVNSGRKIRITFEKADLFNFQVRTLLGNRFDYRINDDINIGATMLFLNEQPNISRISIGDEPTRNLKYGFDVNFRKDSRFITKMVDFLPLIQTKEPSSITFNAEFAQLVPGTSNIVDGEGTSYVDDFENAATPFNLVSSYQNWALGATPRTNNDRYGQEAGGISSNFRRAKMAWYIVDNSIFYRSSSRLKPDHLPGTIANHYERAVPPQEIFPNRSRTQLNLPLPVFDVAYFPEERGPYNYNPNLNDEGRFSRSQARQNFGAITRAITSDVDFDKTNVEYIEFWMLDPFIPGENGRVRDGIRNENNTTGGTLYFNLGSISEDVIPDDRHAFENGLPPNGGNENVATNEFGRVTTAQYLNDAFDNTPSSRQNQDVGWDGYPSKPTAQGLQGENEYFSDYLNQLSPGVRAIVENDPSGDDFQYFLGTDLDQRQASIVERYKSFNGQENNSPVVQDNNIDFPVSNSIQPDNEDLNRDNTVSDLEEYYEYRVDLDPGSLQVGRNNVVDAIRDTDDNGDPVTWYLFRIPVRQPDDVVGNIQGFKTIRYLRMVLSDFVQPVVLRMANFQLVGSQWRRAEPIIEESINLESDVESDFTISVVNIEENANAGSDRIPYVLPPGFNRDRDNTSIVFREANEQSLQLDVKNLRDGESRAVFKNFGLDLINYGSIKMLLHADSRDALDGEVSGFLRLGNDADQNYYQVEVPLEMTPFGTTDPREIWPANNEINIQLGELSALKAQRNAGGGDTRRVGRYLVRIKGNPDLANINTVLIGVKNPASEDRAPKSVRLWANELRVSDFDSRAGYATNARTSIQLADLATVNASTNFTSFGFGGIQSRVSERTREETFGYDVSANVALDKFLPSKFRVKLPMYVSYENTDITPQFDPQNDDILLTDRLRAFDTDARRNEYRDIVTDQTTRRSINFINVRKERNPEREKNHFFDISNFSLSYAYSNVVRSNFDIAKREQRNYQGSLNYTYNFPQLSIKPFANMKGLNSPWFKLIKDFNFSPVPTSVTVRGELNRRFVETRYRNATTLGSLNPIYEKSLTFNRNYNLRWNFTSNLSLDYNARANAVIDEPEDQINGAINTNEEQQYVLDQILNGGRLKNFNQQISANYRVPFNKIPITDWISADARYSAGYSWQAGALNVVERFGNSLQNNREQSASGKVDFVKLYNKIDYLKQINSPRRRRRSRQAQDEEESANQPKLFNAILRTLMSVRSVNATYSVTDGTRLAGFQPSPALFGFDQDFDAPGVPFVLGSQDPGIRLQAAQNGWLSTSDSLTTPFSQSRSVNLNLQASIEPIRDFRIRVDAKKTKTDRYQEIFRRPGDNELDEDGRNDGGYISVNPTRSGNYSISFLSIRTAFISDDENNNSPVFEEFVSNRTRIREQLEFLNPNETLSYDSLSQDVLIPAFIGAYSGADPLDVGLNPFPNIPMPNWQVDYSGLTKLLPQLADVFTSVSLRHAYRSTYSVNNYTSFLNYNDPNQLELNNQVENYRPELLNESVDNGNTFAPVYVIQQVTISEQFSPLIGINVRTKSRLTANLSYRRERNLTLQLTNSQVTEQRSQDISMELGFTKSKFKLPFRVQGRTITLDNDITFRMNVSLRDTETVQRRINEGSTVTNGNLNLQIRPTLSYVLNEKLSLNFYFERTVNEPRVTTSPRRTTTAFGAQLRFNLAQ